MTRRSRFAAPADAILISWGWRRALIGIGAGAVSALALPPLGFFPVLWLTVPVLVLLVDGAAPAPRAGFLARRLPAFAAGWLFGFGYFLGGLWWIGAAFLADAGAFIWLMPFAVVALPAGLALFWGLATALARLWWPEGWRRVVVLALALALAEWLRGHVLTGFPWNAFGYTLMPVPQLMQGVALVGLWGMTLLAFLVFGAPAMLISGRHARIADKLAVAVVAALFLANLGYGVMRLTVAADANVPGVALRLVQPVLAQDEKWTPERDSTVLQRYLSLSGQGLRDGAPPPFTILIWPETALPFFLTDQPNALAAIGALLPPGTTLVTGAARDEPGPDPDAEGRVFNSIYVIGEDGVIRDAYDKVHLVPFGEYLPFDSFFSRFGLHQMVALPGGFSSGRRLRTMEIDGAPPFGPLICYEIIFPGAAIDGRQRPAWLLNVTNDGWFGDTPGPHQHLQQAIVRAVEEGLPLARAANTGISAIVDPYGRVRVSLELGKAGIVDGGLPAALPPTLYSRWGDLVFLVLAGLALMLALVSGFTPAKTRN
ncbi:apolipoprotein N-acyltransferase [Kaistia geumhonensis]|uniref:Apolipoprotein N-acyltransferase n=1 Tax=Kaistia geumhonensis TaxID=410839 RepID=A0ABU0M7G8_9HYPH|nr:apolipoprotein N-acyltransferase [Kaistia geumhonensis]MCX5477866.1 apolipoprotein N-acyltransferase [Kaistia geumhonensis]MDQ0516922.1 apolipoprotein N-acyltransferase [Kaistia geumhonensis]